MTIARKLRVWFPGATYHDESKAKTGWISGTDPGNWYCRGTIQLQIRDKREKDSCIFLAYRV